MININDKCDKQLGYVDVNLSHAKCNLHDFFLHVISYISHVECQHACLYHMDFSHVKHQKTAISLCDLFTNIFIYSYICAIKCLTKKGNPLSSLFPQAFSNMSHLFLSDA